MGKRSDDECGRRPPPKKNVGARSEFDYIVGTKLTLIFVAAAVALRGVQLLGRGGSVEEGNINRGGETLKRWMDT